MVMRRICHFVVVVVVFLWSGYGSALEPLRRPWAMEAGRSFAVFVMVYMWEMSFILFSRYPQIYYFVGRLDHRRLSMIEVFTRLSFFGCLV
jgi:hypothetical protein